MKLDTNDIKFASTVCRAWYMVGAAFKDWLRDKTKELAPPNSADVIDVTRLRDAPLYDSRESQK